MFHIQREVGWSDKVNIQEPSTLEILENTLEVTVSEWLGCHLRQVTYHISLCMTATTLSKEQLQKYVLPLQAAHTCILLHKHSTTVLSYYLQHACNFLNATDWWVHYPESDNPSGFLAASLIMWQCTLRATSLWTVAFSVVQHKACTGHMVLNHHYHGYIRWSWG